MLPGETGHDGAHCSCCSTELKLDVYQSAAGYYLGTACQCGPYSRESGYFGTREEATEALAATVAGDTQYRRGQQLTSGVIEVEDYSESLFPLHEMAKDW